MAKALALAVIGALTLGVLATAAAGKAKTRVESDVTIKNSASGTYDGKVTSAKKKCKKKRDISVYHDEDDDGVDNADFFIGEAVTNNSGKWSMTGEEQAPVGDAVVAIVEEKETRKSICLEAEDSTLAQF